MSQGGTLSADGDRTGMVRGLLLNPARTEKKTNKIFPPGFRRSAFSAR